MNRGFPMGVEIFRYDGKRVLVVGGATGMGAAAAAQVKSLGADVVVMDHVAVDVPGYTSLVVDLRDKDQIDAALDACGGPIDALFSCAGVADGTPGIEKINFIGHRHLIDRAVENGYLGKGSSITMISSAAGLGWEANIDTVRSFCDTPDFDGAVAWMETNPGNAHYMFTKQALCYYVSAQAYAMGRRGIRINAICPGPTDTPLARSNEELWLSFGSDYRAEIGVGASTPEEQGDVMAFLGSQAARYISGQTIITDAGLVGAGLTETYPSATPIVKMLYGRP
jgi:NAD(P)-dependent dehydrogenase (short-subunit alcohol dehydrogenase family)